MSESAKDVLRYNHFDLVKPPSGKSAGRVRAYIKDKDGKIVKEEMVYHNRVLQAYGYHSRDWDSYKLGFADGSGGNQPEDSPMVLLNPTTAEAQVEAPVEYSAIWHVGGSKGSDTPVTVIGSYGTGPDGREYLKIAEGAGGVPANEVERVKDDPNHAFPESSTGRVASSANLNRDEGDRETTTVTTEAVASKEYDDVFRERFTNAGSILELKGEFERKLQSKAIEARGAKTLEELSMLDPRWAEDIRREVCSGVLFEYFENMGWDYTTKGPIPQDWRNDVIHMMQLSDWKLEQIQALESVEQPAQEPAEQEVAIETPVVGSPPTVEAPVAESPEPPAEPEVMAPAATESVPGDAPSGDDEPPQDTRSRGRRAKDFFSHPSKVLAARMNSRGARAEVEVNESDRKRRGRGVWAIGALATGVVVGYLLGSKYGFPFWDDDGDNARNVLANHPGMQPNLNHNGDLFCLGSAVNKVGNTVESASKALEHAGEIPTGSNGPGVIDFAHLKIGTIDAKTPHQFVQNAFEHLRLHDVEVSSVTPKQIDQIAQYMSNHHVPVVAGMENGPHGLQPHVTDTAATWPKGFTANADASAEGAINNLKEFKDISGRFGVTFRATAP